MLTLYSTSLETLLDNQSLGYYFYAQIYMYSFDTLSCDLSVQLFVSCLLGGAVMDGGQ